MDNRKTIFLDSFVLIELAKHPIWTENVREFIERNSYVLAVGVMHLIEIYKWKRYWSEIANFISSVPFVISEKPEHITKAEVEHYPNEISLPLTFDSSKHSYSKPELKEAIEINLKGKIAGFEQNYRKEYRNIWQSILDNKKKYLPDDGKSYSAVEMKVFFRINVLTWLFTGGHQNSLKREINPTQEVNIECFKSIYLPFLAIFVEYYINKKIGKPSDVGDFYQLGIIPYVSISVLDNERHNLIQRINRQGLFSQHLTVHNISEFKGLMGR